ncbi:hypothetical protein DB459_00275 [Bradyrhizobium sp. WD16]|nr:hypothetical protein DB459_00275 [Bradyrhizobium sp. WD16]
MIFDRAPKARLQMRHLSQDIQAFAVGIEDKGTAILVGDLGAAYLTMQFSFQEGHFPLPMTTARSLVRWI